MFVVLAAAWGGKFALVQHLQAAGDLMHMDLQRPLAELPLELGDWRGVDQPVDESFQYADQHLQRVYEHRVRRQRLTLWVAYSKTGADRGHHPEVCMMVAGKPEDRQARQVCEVSGAGAPVQQYRFGRPGQYEWVYYWYYTMVPPAGPNVSEVQRLYQRLRSRPSSMTIEVFAPEHEDEDAEYSQEFVRLLDVHLREHAGAHALRGSQRSPVVLTTAAAET